MTDDKQALENFVAEQPVPVFTQPSFTQPPRLQDARVAIVTSAALYREGDSPFALEDVHFEALPSDARDLKMGHVSPNFNRAGFAADLNVVYPADRLTELCERGTIGSVADFHFAFAGNQPDTLSEMRLDTGPACAKKLLDDKVDVVLLAPV
ncbi:glycine/betaine/sarcosine/D-proline family reductase selenoprotein B [Gammaproteobacteria bacterium]|jgi:D-proline reductase (dithiol) PrdB|nr:glycine/betaine/sarcosine/D-proline family reductase selenoprotein B [Gammaproteobacteria bacterium]